MSKEIIFHEKYYNVYTWDPAAEPGRMEAITQELKEYKFIEPQPATDNDILLVHTENHLERVKSDRDNLYSIALLAVGGAILASEYALQSKPMFAVIRPPGHHASPNGCWGFCYFNNIAIAIKKLLVENKIKRAAIIDFDLHFGDGTRNAFSQNPEVNYYSGKGGTSNLYIQNLENHLSDLSDVDIVGVSAGFDQGIDDWGGLLDYEDYHRIGEILKDFSFQNCHGKRFAVLEGGYNHAVLGKNVKVFLEGFY
jgi:acetoin utilization deacetylase AcuC-like enzyme